MFHTKVVEEIKTGILRSLTYFSKTESFYEILWKKNCGAVQATDDNMAHAHCMLDN